MNKVYLQEHFQCGKCQREQIRFFNYVESHPGEELRFDGAETYILIFMLSGKAKVTCNNFSDVDFIADRVCLLPESCQYKWETLEYTTLITFKPNKYTNPCDLESLKFYTEHWLSEESSFARLHIKSRLKSFLISIKDYLQDGINCSYLHQAKREELSVLLKAYYSTEELTEFFIPLIKDSDEFENLIMNNYLKMKGVKEFVNFSGLNLSTFNRKFKAQFGESPYQWMIKQRSKHILLALNAKDKSIANIMREFGFTDASHFNRYCKTMFGAPPTELRKSIKYKLIGNYSDLTNSLSTE